MPSSLVSFVIHISVDYPASYVLAFSVFTSVMKVGDIPTCCAPTKAQKRAAIELYHTA